MIHNMLTFNGIAVGHALHPARFSRMTLSTPDLVLKWLRTGRATSLFICSRKELSDTLYMLKTCCSLHLLDPWALVRVTLPECRLWREEMPLQSQSYGISLSFGHLETNHCFQPSPPASRTGHVVIRSNSTSSEIIRRLTSPLYNTKRKIDPFAVSKAVGMMVIYSKTT